MDQWLDLSEFLDKAHELIDIGLFEEAEALLDRYAPTFSDEWELYFLYSRLHAEQNKPAEAIPYLHRGLELDQDNIDCLLGLFYSYSLLHQLDEAGVWLAKAEKLYPDDEAVISSCIWYYAEINQLETAIAHYERISGKGAMNPETLRNAGIAYDRAGFYEKAVECFKTALELHPQYDEARELLADLYIAEGEPDKAVELYKKALDTSPNNIRYLSRLVFCLSQDGRQDRAIEVAEESVRLYPNSPIGHVDCAYAYLNNGSYEKALAAAERALAISPLDAESHRVKAIILSDQAKDADAEKSFETALSIDPDNIEIQRDYYQHFRQTGNDKKMEEIIYSMIRKNDSSCMEEYWYLAEYYKEKNELSKALHCFHRAYAIRPGEHDLLALISEVLIERGHLLPAVRFMKRYIDYAGWNEVTEHLFANPHLRGRRFGEGVRFLRYCGSKPADYYRYLFRRCFLHALTASGFAVLFAAALPATLLFGKYGLSAIGVSAAGIIGVAVAARLSRKKLLPLAGKTA